MHTRLGSSNPPRKRRGPNKDEFADSEILTVLRVGELCQVKRERAWLRQVRASYGRLFAHLPEDSRFARRAEAVRERLGHFRAAVLGWGGEDVHPGRMLDSFPRPLCACYRIRPSSMPISGSRLGYNRSKCVSYFGLHPGLLWTERGSIDALFLAPGYLADPDRLQSYLDEGIQEGRALCGQEWIADKGFVGKALKEAAKSLLGLTLLVRERDYPGRFIPFFQHLLDKLRKPIEGVLWVLTEHLGLEHLLVQTDIGVYRRAQAQATAFSLARYFNEGLGIAPMDIARYAV